MIDDLYRQLKFRVTSTAQDALPDAKRDLLGKRFSAYNNIAKKIVFCRNKQPSVASKYKPQRLILKVSPYQCRRKVLEFSWPIQSKRLLQGHTFYTVSNHIHWLNGIFAHTPSGFTSLVGP